MQRVQPAVVNVYAAKMVQNRNPLLDDPIFRRFFGVPGDQPEQMQRSLGSGVMVDPSGLVHVAGMNGFVAAINPTTVPPMQISYFQNAFGGNVTSRISPAEVISI